MNPAQTARLNKAIADIEARPVAEKAVVMGLLVIGIFMGFLTYVSDPLTARQALLEADIANTARQIQTQQAAYEQKLAQSQEDPNRFANEQLARVRVEQERLDQEINSLAGGLVTPNNMTQILTAALRGHEGLALQQIQNLPVRPLHSGGNYTASASTGDDGVAVAELTRAREAGQVYEHGIVLEFTGDYFSTLRYLGLLESLTSAFFWDSIEFQQLQWPNATVRVQLHTLSTQEGFLGV